MVNLWRDQARDKDFEVIISVDGDDKASFNAASAVSNCKVVVQDSLPGNCVKGWNKAAEQSTGKVIITISDDFYPIREWDVRLLRVSDPDWINRRHVVMVSDGYVNDLCTLPIMTRVRYEELGYFFYPRYESIYSDTDLTYHALHDGIMIKALNLVFCHYHPDNKMRTRDAVDLIHSSSARYASGKVIFDARKAAGFPKDL